MLWLESTSFLRFHSSELTNGWGTHNNAAVVPHVKQRQRLHKAMRMQVQFFAQVPCVGMTAIPE